MKSVLSTAALALTLSLLAGCGSDSKDDAAAAAPETSAAPSASASAEPEVKAIEAKDLPKPNKQVKAKVTGSPKPAPKPAKPLTPAEQTAAKMAAAGSLVAADFPGFTSDTAAPSPEELRAEKKRYACLKMPFPAFAARGIGRYWVNGPTQYLSAADAFGTAKAAEQEATASKPASAAACYLTPLKERFGGEGTTTTGTASIVPVSVKGASDAYAVKFAITVEGTQDPKKYTGYLIGAIVGSVRVTLLSVHVDGVAPTLADAANRAAVAVARVEAAEKS